MSGPARSAPEQVERTVVAVVFDPDQRVPVPEAASFGLVSSAGAPPGVEHPASLTRRLNLRSITGPG